MPIRILSTVERPDEERRVDSSLGTSVEAFEAVRRFLTDPLVTRVELEKEGP